MLQGIGPKFVEATGKQLVSPYCQYKFRAPQGTRDQITDYYLEYFRHKVYIGVFIVISPIAWFSTLNMFMRGQL